MLDNFYDIEKYILYLIGNKEYNILNTIIYLVAGISTLSSCGDPERLPELPPSDEHRLQRAALILQQKLILREWLKENRLQHHYSR